MSPTSANPTPRVYLAGPMRGIENFNFPAFDFAAAKLREQGYIVFSPAERDREVHGTTLEQNATGNEDEAASNVGFSLREALKADCDWICDHATHIALLPGADKSKGAKAEKALGEALGLSFIELGREYVK